jgi:hypothetical protein
MDVKTEVAGLLTGLYSDKVIDEVSAAAAHYATERLENPKYADVPSDLHGVTDAKRMSSTIVHADDIDCDVLKHLGILKEAELKGPLNHMVARMFTVPRMLKGYIQNLPSEQEKSIYTDPQLLQYEISRLKGLYETYFTQASDMLEGKDELLKRFKQLGEFGEMVCDEIENVYPATNSTEAYELFGIFHLFPNNEQVGLTSTSPGVILPTEADPLKYKDSVDMLKKNLLRPTYFEMLSNSVVLDAGRSRRYFASREGTRKNLLAYPQLIDAAKEILSRYLELGKGVFEIRTGQPFDDMKKVTLVGKKGVVYSIRDPGQKEKIAHNLTVIDEKEGLRWKEMFDKQWDTGDPIDSVDVIDRLIA